MNRFYLFSFLFLNACTFDPGARPSECRENSDCSIKNQICVQGSCTQKARRDVGGEDISTGIDSGDSGSDLGLCEDKDNDGFFHGEGCGNKERDCDDSNNSIFPGAKETCNGLDNDCNGETKPDCDCLEGAQEVCGSDTGTCQKGMRSCLNGQWGDCQGEITPIEEICGDTFDNNCDANLNEGCPCSSGETADCGTDIGACKEGTQTCVNGLWSECQGATLPSEELCDNIDNDCNGDVDDLTEGVGGACPTGRLGECASGSIVCNNGNLSCQSVKMPSAEVCDNLDNDCDGIVDAFGQECMTACGKGEQVCSNGRAGDCQPLNPPQEICDGIDNDCDSRIDESFPEEGQYCSTNLEGVCDAGTSVCMNGVLACNQNESPSSENCDGLDNDCDGLTDEDGDGFVLIQRCNGGCPQGAYQLCEAGAYGACDHRDVEFCNGADSNCDGLSNNRSACYVACPGGGLARGTQVCVGNGEVCTLPEEICGDGIDNDCDGIVDRNCRADIENMAFIPAGTFLMGAGQDPLAENDERPQHIVDLKPYYIDLLEVSRADYVNCITNGNCSATNVQGCGYQGALTLPMTCLNFNQAQNYCAVQGKRLPTEAEWEKAARGPFSRDVIYPWGDNANLSFANMACAGNFNQCLVATTEYPQGASYYGLLNMAGNAGEMVLDRYNANFYQPGIVSDPVFIGIVGPRVTRGGLYNQDLEFGRVTNRAAFSLPEADVGFRCAVDF